MAFDGLVCLWTILGCIDIGKTRTGVIVAGLDCLEPCISYWVPSGCMKVDDSCALNASRVAYFSWESALVSSLLGVSLSKSGLRSGLSDIRHILDPDVSLHPFKNG